MIGDRFSLAGRTALVTGAATGIGRAIAIGLAEAGADLVVHCRRSGDAADTIAAITADGRKAFEAAGDLAQREAPADILAQALRHFESIDILVNNAGTIRRAPAVETSEEDWDHVIEVDLSSVFRMSQAVGRQMLAGSRGGRIINIASLLSFQGGINVPAYTAAKSGVAGLTKALANEWAKHGVCVNAIAPGYIATKNTAALQADEVRDRQIRERIPAGRWGEPDDLAGAAVFLASDAARYINGHVLVVDGGWMGR